MKRAARVGPFTQERGYNGEFHVATKIIYKHMKKILYFSLLLGFLSSCVDNPYVDEEAYLETENPTSSWVNGLKRQLALTMNEVTTNTELVSDNYFNNYTSFSKVFDIPEIDYADVDVNNFQSEIGALRSMAEYGLGTVAPADEEATDEDKSYMNFCKAYALILSGENFVGLPDTTKGPVVEWKDLLENSLGYLDKAIDLTSDESYRHAYTLLKARVYRDLGNADQAKTYAAEVIDDTDLLFEVEFDGENDVDNEMQYATFSSTQNMFAPLPRLDFLDPKYYDEGTSETDQKPVAIAKAEEAFLILAEAYVAEGSISLARTTLTSLITGVVAGRAVASVDDSSQKREGSNRSDYPVTAVSVKFDSSGPYRSGYVLDRQDGNITVYPVSGTKVTADDIRSATSEDDLLYLIYRLRQEIFISEGRRMSDLGIRFPVSQTEQLNNPNVTDEYTKANIPSFIPLDYGMDDFSVDASTGNVTMAYDMNKVLIGNKSSDDVLPFN